MSGRFVRLYTKLLAPGDLQLPTVSPAAPAPTVAAPMGLMLGVSPGKLRGRATTYNAMSSDLGGFRIRLSPTTFADSLKSSRPVYAAWQHDDHEIFGSTRNGSLRLTSNDVGLFCELDVLGTARGLDVFTLVAGGAVAEMSVGFQIIESDFKHEGKGKNVTIIEDVTKAVLAECSVVLTGAMPQTSIRAVAPQPASAAPGLSARSPSKFLTRAEAEARIRTRESINRMSRFAHACR